MKIGDYDLTIKEHYQILKDFFDLINDDTRFRIIANLFVYHKLGLSDLVQLLAISKSAVSRQMKKLVHSKIVVESTQKSRGAYPKKIYSIDSALLNIPPSYLDYRSEIPTEEFNLCEIYRYEVFASIANHFTKMFQLCATTLQDRADYLKTISIPSPLPPIPFSIFQADVTKAQYPKMIEGFSKVIQEVQQENPDPDAIRPYFVFYGSFPAQFMLDPNSI